MISQAALYPECLEACPRVLELKERVRELEEKLVIKEERNKRLRKKLRKHENAHTPSSKKHGTTKSGSGSGGSGGGGCGGSSQEKPGEKKRGRKKGHKGETGSKPEPDRTEVVMENSCKNCGRELGEARKKNEILSLLPNKR